MTSEISTFPTRTGQFRWARPGRRTRARTESGLSATAESQLPGPEAVAIALAVEIGAGILRDLPALDMEPTPDLVAIEAPLDHLG